MWFHEAGPSDLPCPQSAVAHICIYHLLNTHWPSWHSLYGSVLWGITSKACSSHIWKDSKSLSPLVVNPPRDSKCEQNSVAFPSSSGPLSLTSAFSACFPLFSSSPSLPPSSSFPLVLITTLSSVSSTQSSWSFLSSPLLSPYLLFPVLPILQPLCLRCSIGLVLC